MKFCLLFNLSPCARYCLLIGSQLTTWSQGNLHYIRLRVTNLQVRLLSARSRIFLHIATQSCAALFCCRLAIRASSLGWLVGNKGVPPTHRNTHLYPHTHTQRFLIPVFTVSARTTQQSFCVLNTKEKNGLQIMSLAAYAGKTNKPSHILVRDKQYD